MFYTLQIIQGFIWKIILLQKEYKKQSLIAIILMHL